MCGGVVVTCDGFAVLCGGVVVTCDGFAVMCGGVVVTCDGFAVMCGGVVLDVGCDMQLDKCHALHDLDASYTT